MGKKNFKGKPSQLQKAKSDTKPKPEVKKEQKKIDFGSNQVFTALYGQNEKLFKLDFPKITRKIEDVELTDSNTEDFNTDPVELNQRLTA